MKRTSIIVSFLYFMLFVSCQSNAEKRFSEGTALQEQYIKDLNNARSEEEVKNIRKEYNEHINFIEKKVSKEEFDELNKNMSWDKHNEQKDRNRRVTEAEDNAYYRFKKK